MTAVRLTFVAMLSIVACACDRAPPTPGATAAPTDPAAFAADLRQFDRDVMERLRRLPVSARLPEEQKAIDRCTTLTAPASAADIEDLERRIGKRLPSSYRAFLATTNGMMYEGAQNQVTMLPAREVAPLAAGDYPGLGVWLAMPDVAIPLDATAGGPLPGPALARAWRLSSIEDGDVYFIFPALADATGEWPVWFFGPKNPGAIGRASFRAMLEYERAAAVRALDARLAVRR